MPATPADIARYTVDGQTVTLQLPALKAQLPNAIDLGEIPTFFRYAEDAQELLNEREALQARLNVLHEMIEVDESLGLGIEIPVVPNVPTFRIIDDDRSVDSLGRVIASAFDMEIDRYSIEVIG